MNCKDCPYTECSGCGTNMEAPEECYRRTAEMLLGGYKRSAGVPEAGPIQHGIPEMNVFPDIKNILRFAAAVEILKVEVEKGRSASTAANIAIEYADVLIEKFEEKYGL